MSRLEDECVRALKITLMSLPSSIILPSPMPQRELRRLVVVLLLLPILYVPPPFRLDSLRGLPRDRPP
eukprot:5942228-Pyramimonas_sp.AAC.1